MKKKKTKKKDGWETKTNLIDGGVPAGKSGPPVCEE